MWPFSTIKALNGDVQALADANRKLDAAVAWLERENNTLRGRLSQTQSALDEAIAPKAKRVKAK